MRLNSAPTLIYRRVGPCAPFVIHPLPVNARIQLSVPKQLLEHPSNTHSPTQSTSIPATTQITAHSNHFYNQQNPTKLPTGRPPGTTNTHNGTHTLLKHHHLKNHTQTNTLLRSPSASSPPQQPQPPPPQTSAPPPPPASTTPSATTSTSRLRLQRPPAPPPHPPRTPSKPASAPGSSSKTTSK